MLVCKCKFVTQIETYIQRADIATVGYQPHCRLIGIGDPTAVQAED